LHVGGHSAGGHLDGTLAWVLLAVAAACAAVIVGIIRPLPPSSDPGQSGMAAAEHPGAFG
jgi:hypothetical protein